MTIDHASLDPFAVHFLDGYHETAIFNRRFMDDYGMPPTLLTKAHHLRSVVQARLAQDEDFQLLPKFSEFGRVQFIDKSGNELVLRSASALLIERGGSEQTHEQLPLFELGSAVQLSPVKLLIYKFAPDGLHLSTCAARQLPKKARLLAFGHATFQGVWRYSDGGGDGGGGGNRGIFPQDNPDDFGDIGDLDLGDEDEGEGEG
jgi:hypothetical protein